MVVRIKIEDGGVAARCCASLARDCGVERPFFLREVERPLLEWKASHLIALVCNLNGPVLTARTSLVTKWRRWSSLCGCGLDPNLG
jgi:hypothetical protein